VADLSGIPKQYHFWPGSQGRDAWDVDRLIELASGLPVELVPLDSIGEIDSPYWFDANHPATVRAVVEHARLIAKVDPRLPIILGPDGRVMDGMHRIARALLDGHKMIDAVRLPALPAPDFVDVQPATCPTNADPVIELGSGTSVAIGGRVAERPGARLPGRWSEPGSPALRRCDLWVEGEPT